MEISFLFRDVERRTVHLYCESWYQMNYTVL